MKIKSLSIDQIRKYLKKKGFTINKKKNEKEESNIGAISRTFLSSLIIISFFFIIPLFINFKNDRIIFSKDYENNSKNELKILLKNQGQKLDNDVDLMICNMFLGTQMH